MAWTDKILIGVKPVVGYKLNQSLALQVGYGVNISKTSRQSSVESNGLIFYEQGVSVEWKQTNLEVLGLFYPDSDLNYYFFGGMDMTTVDTDITIFENAEYQDNTGQIVSNAEFTVESDKITAFGFILGAGVEFTSANHQRAVYVSLQYSRTMTDDKFFVQETLKADMGGFALMAGMKWFLF